jgi:hypothetical protein
MIGLYGTIFFHSGSTGLSTFNEMRKTVTARWNDHPVHMSKPLLEYSGPQLIEVTFRMELIKPFTVDPLSTIITLEEIMDLAIPLPLIIGMKPMGRGVSLFVLTNLQHEMKYFYRDGGLLGASVEVQLKEYPDTFTISNLMRALGGLFGQAGPSAGLQPVTDVSAGGLSPAMSADDIAGYNAGLNEADPFAAGGSLDPTIAQNAAGNIASNVAPEVPNALPDPSSLPSNEEGLDVARQLEAKETAAVPGD